VLRFVFFRLALADFNFRFARLVSMYEASVSAAIDMILFGEVVLVNEPLSHARNADKNPLWISFFSFALCQWPIPRIAFQLGSFPGTVSLIVIKVRSRWLGAGERRCAVFPAVTTLPCGGDPRWLAMVARLVRRRRALRARAANVVLSAAVAELGVGGQGSHHSPSHEAMMFAPST